MARLLLEEEVLITDGPTMFAPGTLDVADLNQVSGFELRAFCRKEVENVLAKIN